MLLQAQIKGESFTVEVKDLKHHRLGLSYTVTGYGKKIPTRYMVSHNGKKYRIYCIIYSNIVSHYIIVRGERVIVTL